MSRATNSVSRATMAKPTCSHPSGPVTEVHVEAFVAGHIAGLSGPNGTLAFAEVQLAELVIIHLGLVPKQPRTLNGSENV